MGWADKYRTMKVRTNADTPADAKKARELGAEGIGLCRTEHMFFEGNRIDNPTRYSHIMVLTPHFYAHIGAGLKVILPPVCKLMWA